ncbi:MAG: hypothetical protein AAGE52_36850, partial [Myxococcota bacterium]
RVVGSFGTWGAGVRPRTLDLTMNNPEVHLLADTRLPQGALERRSNVGGAFFGIGYRPLRWLRVPEVRVFLGGGDLDTRWRSVDNDLEVSARRLLSVRLEAVAGVEYDLGPITPFLRTWGAVDFLPARVRVRHADLGRLGSERARSVRGEVGLEAGANIMLSDESGIMLAYRYGLHGPLRHGALVALAIRGDVL